MTTNNQPLNLLEPIILMAKMPLCYERKPNLWMKSTQLHGEWVNSTQTELNLGRGCCEMAVLPCHCATCTARFSNCSKHHSLSFTYKPSLLVRTHSPNSEAYESLAYLILQYSSFSHLTATSYSTVAGTILIDCLSPAATFFSFT